MNASKIVIQGGNGFGKSAIIKSIYETLGAAPQKIDDRWRQANVSSALVFEFRGKRYTVVKAHGMHALFDSDRRIIFSGRQITKEWAPLLADFFDFRLIMTDREGEIVVPPPSYIFAPFYIDQDGGWNRSWSSFKDFYLPDSSRTLSDYHSGLRPDAYYEARANLAADRILLSESEASIETLREAISQLQQINHAASPTYDLGEFVADVEEIVNESENLLAKQRSYRSEISQLHEEEHILRAEKTLLEATLREMDEEFDIAAVLPDKIECPTCGQIYANDLADRFALIKDQGVLIDALGVANMKLNAITKREREQQRKLCDIENSLGRIARTLKVERASMSFNDVVIGAGKTEAVKILRASLGEKVVSADSIRARIDEYKNVMSNLTSNQRSSEILKFYRGRIAEFALELDVTLESSRSQSIQTIQAARGSEGPRGLLSYYYAFLYTRGKFTNSTSFPIVIDAPNQQGQDAVHLPQMLEFIFERAPAGAQVIVASEEVGSFLPNDVAVHTYGERRRQVLREVEFEDVRERFEHYTKQMFAE